MKNQLTRIKQWIYLYCATSLAMLSALAADGTWIRAGGSDDYGYTGNWEGGIVAEGAGATLYSRSPDQMNLPVPPAAGITTNVTIGHIVIPADASVNSTVTMDLDFNSAGHTESLIMDSGTPGTAATIANNCASNTARIKLRNDVELRSDLNITSEATTQISKPNTTCYLTGSISEDGSSRGITIDYITAGNQVSLFGHNTFSGNINVQQGILRAQSYTSLGGEGHQFGQDNTIIATNAGSQVDLGGFSFGEDQSMIISGNGVNDLGILVASPQTPCYTSLWSGTITLAGDSTIGMGYCAHYPRRAGGPIMITGAIGDQGASNSLSKTSDNILFLRGTNTYSGGTILLDGYVSAVSAENLGTGPLNFSGGALLLDTPFDITTAGLTLTNTSDVRLRLETDVTFDGSLESINGEIEKSGPGTLTLTRTGDHQNTLIHQGTLNLDYTEHIEAKLPPAWYVRLYNNARMNIIGGEQAFTNSINRVLVQSGCAGTINISGADETLFNLEGLNSVALYTGSSLDLQIEDGTILSLPKSNYDGADMLDSSMTYNGSAFVTKVAWNDGTVIPYSSATNGWDTTTDSHVDVTSATPILVPTNALVRTIRFNDPAASQITLEGDTALSRGAILVTPDMGANDVHIQGGSLTSSQSDELVIHQYNTQAVLRISSILTNTPSSSALTLTKTGPGTLVLSDVPNTFSGKIYVIGGTLDIESPQAFGATNVSYRVYVYNGSTLRLQGNHAFGNPGQHVLYVNEPGGTIDVPNADDHVTILGRIGQQFEGNFTKTGAGLLQLTDWTQSANEAFLYVPKWNYNIEEGTIYIGDNPNVGVRWLSGECLVKITVKNNAVLMGAGFLYGRGVTNGGGISEDEQGAVLIHVDETGGIVDLHGSSVLMGQKGNETYSCDHIAGPGCLTVTNSSETAATVRFYGMHLNHFTGIFDAAPYWDESSYGGGVPNGEFTVDEGISLLSFSYTFFPFTHAFGKLTGSGSFGGRGVWNQSTPPLLVGRDADETFEFSGYLEGRLYSGGYANPFRYTKTGSNTWRISGTNNNMVADITVRSGTILVGADSPGQGQDGALGGHAAVLGDEETLNNDAALLTDGTYTIGNDLVLNQTEGTLTLGGNQTNGASLFTSDLELTRDVILTSANTDANGVTFSGTITGPGGITKTGEGTVYLASLSSTGSVTVLTGELVVQDDLALSNELTVAVWADGSATFSVEGNLTLAEGSTLNISGSDVVIGEIYTLISWNGSYSGAFSTVNGLPDEWHVGIRDDKLQLYYAPAGTIIIIH